MKQRSVLVADELDNQSEAAKKRSEAIRHLASDLSVLLHCQTDLIFVKRLSDLIGKKALSVENRHRIINADYEKYHTVIHSFQRPGELFIKLGWPIEQITKFVNKERRFEALVIGTRGLQPLERFFLGSVAEEVVRHIDRPVFILGPKALNENYRLRNHKKLHFVIATDLTKKCRPAETYAVSLAKRTGASLTFYYNLANTLFTAQTFSYGSGEMLPSLNTLVEDIKKDAYATMTKKLEHLKKQGLSVSSYIEDEDSNMTDSLMKLTEDKALVIMGHQSHGTIASAIIGSNVRAMVETASIPVVVIRS